MPQALAVIGPALTAIGTSVVNAAGAVGPALTNAVAAVGPALTNAATAVGPAITNAVGQIGPALAKGATFVGEQLASGANALGSGLLQGVMGGGGQAAPGALGSLPEMAAQVARSAGPGALTGMNPAQLATAVANTAPGVASSAPGLLTGMNPATIAAHVAPAAGPGVNGGFLQGVMSGLGVPGQTGGSKSGQLVGRIAAGSMGMGGGGQEPNPNDNDVMSRLDRMLLGSMDPNTKRRQGGMLDAARGALSEGISEQGEPAGYGRPIVGGTRHGVVPVELARPNIGNSMLAILSRSRPQRHGLMRG